MFQKFRLKPTSTEAIQWDGTIERGRFLNSLPGFAHYENANTVDMASAYGAVSVPLNAWVVKGVNGYFICSEEDFGKNYVKEEPPKPVTKPVAKEPTA